MKWNSSPSITLRLTLLFASVSTAVLLMLGFLIGAAVEQHFVEQDMEVLTGKLELTAQALAKTRSRAELEALPGQLDPALIGHHGLAMRVIAADGRTLFATEGADFPPSLLEQPPASGTGRPRTWVTAQHLPLRGISSRVATGIAGETAIVAIATDISHHQHFMASFRATLWVFVALAALATGLFGWLAARRGLAPLQAIQRAAAEVTADRLHTRLVVDAVPAELQAIVATLNAMLERLEDSFRRLSDFSSDLAHELRTPLSNLLTQTQVTLSRPRPAEEYREILSSNSEELERLGRMITDMLFLAKADNGLIVPNRETVDLAVETRELFDFYEALAEEKDVALTLAGEGTVQGDRLMLRRAIANLLANALRHCPQKGWIRVEIAAIANPAATCLTVRNSGQPIPAEHLPRLFDRFYRADASRHRTSEGSGLGLAITRSIMRAHGGDISVTTGQGENAFELRWPEK